MNTMKMASHHLVVPELADNPVFLKGIERSALRQLEKSGAVVMDTLRIQKLRADPANPADYDDDGNFIDLVTVRFSAEVIPSTD